MMKYTFIFLSIGTYLMIISLKLGIVGWLIFWFGINFMIVGAAYGWLGARVFGKRPDGKMAVWSIGLLMPYLFLTWLIWHLQRMSSQEKCCHEIAPGIWLGRRAFLQELPENISLIVDLTAELPELQNVISGKTYICLPTLDTLAPDKETFLEVIHKISTWQGNIYIHCALGHGRSATVAAATLLAKGLARNVHQAEESLKKVRPSIVLSKAQRQLLQGIS
jgi:protein-tyrosine phosphatase